MTRITEVREPPVRTLKPAREGKAAPAPPQPGKAPFPEDKTTLSLPKGGREDEHLLATYWG